VHKTAELLRKATSQEQTHCYGENFTSYCKSTQLQVPQQTAGFAK